MKFWRQLFLLLVFVFGGFVVCLVFSMALVLALGGDVQSPLVLHLLQWSQVVLMMSVPALLWGRYVMRTSPYSQPTAFRVNNWPRMAEGMSLGWPGWRALGLGLCLMLVATPWLDGVSVFFRTLPYPASLQAHFETESVVYNATILKLLSVGGIGGLVESFLLMCLGAAVSEELVFRGALFSVFRYETLWNVHVVALLLGLIFSLIHFDLYGLVPRWLMGTMFVYLTYYTGSIWPGVAAHTLNNTMALLQYRTVSPDELDRLGTDYTFGWPLVLVSVVATVLLGYVLVKNNTIFAKNRAK